MQEKGANTEGYWLFFYFDEYLMHFKSIHRQFSFFVKIAVVEKPSLIITFIQLKKTSYTEKKTFCKSVALSDPLSIGSKFADYSA